MVNKLILLILLLLSTKNVTSQSSFEKLLPISDLDTSALGYDLLRDEINNIYYVLSNIQHYDTSLSSGILIDGPLTYGSKISKLNSMGELEWNKLYYTNCYNDCFGDLQLYGRVPSEKILLDNSNKLILPFSHFGGLRICEGGQGAFSFYTRMISIDTGSGEIIDDNDTFFEDFGCKNEKVLDGIKEGDAISILAEDTYNHRMLFMRYDESLNIIDSLVFLNNRRPHFIDEVSGDLVGVWKEFTLFFDINGSLIDSISFSKQEIVNYSVKQKFFANESYLAFLVNGKIDIGAPYSSSIIIFDREHQLVSRKTFSNRRITNAQFLGERIIFSEDLSIGFLDSLEKPIGVGIFNINLEEEAFAKYGFPYVKAEKLKVFNDVSFGVVGSRLKSFIDLEDGRQSDMTYVLVDNISNLIVGIKDVHISREFVKVYPNPAIEQITVQLPKGIKTESITFLNQMGQKVWEGDIDENSNINISSLQKGLYYLVIYGTHGQNYMKKFVKM